MPNKKFTYHIKYSIAVSGAAQTGHCAKNAPQLADAVGREIAKRGLILLTGATTGIPYFAAKGAKQAGGIVIGFSPAASEREHIKKYHLPVDFHDIIVYTGFEYSGRNLILTRAANGVIFICGRMGTLNEFTIGFEDQKPLGILEGSGGTADLMHYLVDNAHRGPGKMVYNSDPKKLVDDLIELIKRAEKHNHKK